MLGFGARLWKQIKTFLNRYLGNRLKAIGGNLETILTELWANFDLNAFYQQVLLAIAINLLRAMVLFVLAVSLGINVSFVQALICRSLIGLVNFIPISNSGLGTRDAVLLMVLPLWGISQNAAIALGLTAFLWTVFSKAAGVIFWFKYPLPIKEIGALKRDLFIPPLKNRDPKEDN